MNHEWSIQARGNVCSTTGEPFKEGEHFYTLLFEEGLTLRREDISAAAFKARPSDAPVPVYFWRTKFELPPAKPAEALGKQTAEDLLRRYLTEASPQHANACYILALMLERKRVLKEVETRESDGKLTRIYERAKTGEVFLIVDPRLRLDQVAEVQMEVAELLGAPAPAPVEAPAPVTVLPENSGEPIPLSEATEPVAPTDSAEGATEAPVNTENAPT